MSCGRLGRAVRAVAVTGAPAGLCVLLVGAVASEARRLRHHHGELAFDDLLLVCALVVLAAAAGWLTVALVLTLGTQLLRCGHTAAGRLAHRMTPALCRALCRALLGGACGAAVLAGPAVAVPATGGQTVLPVPDRPVDLPAAQVDPVDTSVRVRPGDTLWSIAGRHLPTTAPDADVARAWPVWFRRNRGAVGPDPHLIHPGTRLTVPPRFR